MLPIKVMPGMKITKSRIALIGNITVGLMLLTGGYFALRR